MTLLTVTAVTGSTLTVVRGAQGTTPLAHGAGADLYKSPAGTVPAAGVRTRLSLAFKPGGAATDWRVGLYNDTTGALLTQGNGTTAAVSGALGDMYFGKAGWSSGPATTAFDVRAIRVEAGRWPKICSACRTMAS